MRKLGFLVLLLGATACSQPDFYDTSGKGYLYSQLRGNWLVINYWATWCAPCIKEIPELTALGTEHENVIVFGVNYDQPDPDEMNAQIEKMGITFPVMRDDPYLYYGIERPQVLPTTLIVDPEGQLVGELVGPQTESLLLQAMGLE